MHEEVAFGRWRPLCEVSVGGIYGGLSSIRKWVRIIEREEASSSTLIYILLAQCSSCRTRKKDGGRGNWVPGAESGKWPYPLHVSPLWVLQWCSGKYRGFIILSWPQILRELSPNLKSISCSLILQKLVLIHVSGALWFCLFVWVWE